MNPYPFLIPVDGRHLPGVERSHAASIARACTVVARRTGTKPYYHINLESVLFMLGDDLDRGGGAEEVVFDRGRFLPIDPERTTRRIQRAAGMGKRRKRAVQSANEKRHKDAMERYAQIRADDIRPEVQSAARHMIRVLEDGRHSRPSVLI